MTDLAHPPRIRSARADDAQAILRIYTPIVTETAISFEVEVPSVEEVQRRIALTLERFPWLVSEDEHGEVDGYVYSSQHRERAAYQWSVDVTAYVRSDARGRGIGKSLYNQLFDELATLGYFNAFAGIALPNVSSIALHESVGFKFVGIYRSVGYKLGAWHDVSWWQRPLQPPTTPRPPTMRRTLE